MKIDGRTFNTGRPAKGKGSGAKRVPEHMKNIVMSSMVHPLHKMLIDAEAEKLMISKNEMVRQIINHYFGIKSEKL